MAKIKKYIDGILSAILIIVFIIFFSSCGNHPNNPTNPYSYKDLELRFGDFEIYSNNKVENTENNQYSSYQFRDTTIAKDSISTRNNQMIAYNYDWGVKFVKTFNNLSEIAVRFNSDKTLNLYVNHTSSFSCVWKFVIWKWMTLNLPYKEENGKITAKISGISLGDKLIDLWFFGRNEILRENYHFKHDCESFDFKFTESSYLEIELK